MEIDKSLLEKVLGELGLPANGQTINRIIVLLQARDQITDADKKLGFDDDMLDDIMLRLKTKDGTMTTIAKKMIKAISEQ